MALEKAKKYFNLSCGDFEVRCETGLFLLLFVIPIKRKRQ
jgi:hypothetical protein